MNLSDSVLYPYILAILASLAMILLTRHGAREGKRRTFPDITLEPYAPAQPDSESEASDDNLIGKPTFVNTDLALPSQTELSGDLVVKGSLTLGDGARLHGSAKASRFINLGSRAFVVGNLVSDSDISVGAGAEVVGVVHAKDNVWLMPSSYVSMSVVSARKVYAYEGVKVGRRISASLGVVYQPSQILPQAILQRPKDYALTSRQVSGPACYRCRSSLLRFDLFARQWRCFNCGIYQGSVTRFLRDFSSANRTRNARSM